MGTKTPVAAGSSYASPPDGVQQAEPVLHPHALLHVLLRPVMVLGEPEVEGDGVGVVAGAVLAIGVVVDAGKESGARSLRARDDELCKLKILTSNSNYLYIN